nr:hypothetical protein [Deltaproteobacteria bacterium]
MRSVFAPALSLCLAACSEPATTPPADAATPASDVSVDAPSPADAPPPAAPLRATAPYVRYVDPRIGTGGLGFGTGSAYPGPQRAFGLARPGPDTSNDRGDAPVFSH